MMQSEKANNLGGIRDRQCYLCGEKSEGDVCQFWAGFLVHYDEVDLGSKVRISREYRDLNRHSVFVCDDCAASLRRKKHMLGVIAWGTVIAISGIGALVTYFTRFAGDGTIYAVGTLGFFALIGVCCILYEIVGTRSGEWSREVTEAVLKKVKLDPVWREKGDSFLTPIEYDNLFADDYPDQPLTAEELIARARSEDLD